MASPIIESIDEQNLIIGEYWELEVSIENDPVLVTVEGVGGGMMEWNPDTNILKITGEPHALVQGETFKISAWETDKSTPITSEIIYNIVSAHHP